LARLKLDGLTGVAPYAPDRDRVTVIGEEAAMPDEWNANTYRERAEAWRQRAAQLSGDDDQQLTCLSLAADYERLANLIEQRAEMERRIPPSREA
jgi:hypothetical protein